MTLHTAAHTAGGVEDAVSARLAAVALWALNGPGPLDVRTGVVAAPGSPMQVLGTSSTSPWTVTVNPGHIVTSKGDSNGVYYSCNDGLYTVTLSPPPASNSRIDTIYAMQQDAAAIVFPDGSTAAVISAVTGTSGNGGLGASPTAPAVPTGAIALATVQIFSTATAGTSGANVTLTNLAWPFTVPRGNAIPVRNSTERGALTPYNGMTAYDLSLGVTFVADYSGVWRQMAPFAQCDGSFNVTTTSGTPNIATVINLPTGLFTTTPNVQMSWYSASGYEPGMRLYSMSASSFGINVMSGAADQGPVVGTVFWLATQSTALTA